jgi:hypothetical protein
MMNPAELKDAVLSWLAFSPFARGNVNINEIRQGIEREHPIYRNHGTLISDISKILSDLLQKGYIETWESDVSHYTEIGKPPKIIRERKFTTTIHGQIAAYEISLKTKTPAADGITLLPEVLKLIPSYGKIDWTIDVCNPLKILGHHEGKIRYFLLANGFTTKERAPNLMAPGDHQFEVLTDRGRRLKEIGDYDKYNEALSAEKIQESANQRLLQEINSKQSEYLSNQIETNRRARTTNFYVAVFTGAAALWYIRDIAKGILSDFFPNNNIFHPDLSDNVAKTFDLIYLIIFGSAIVYFWQRRQKEQQV